MPRLHCNMLVKPPAGLIWRIAEKNFGIHSLVLPTMPFGPTPEHKNYGSGYIDVPKDLHEALFISVLKSLAEQGFRRIVVWRGCGQHDFRETVVQFNEEHQGKTKAYLPDLPYHDIWMRLGDPANPGVLSDLASLFSHSAFLAAS